MHVFAMESSMRSVAAVPRRSVAPTAQHARQMRTHAAEKLPHDWTANVIASAKLTHDAAQSQAASSGLLPFSLAASTSSMESSLRTSTRA